jgi:hypothetical protein
MPKDRGASAIVLALERGRAKHCAYAERIYFLVLAISDTGILLMGILLMMTEPASRLRDDFACASFVG